MLQYSKNSSNSINLLKYPWIIFSLHDYVLTLQLLILKLYDIILKQDILIILTVFLECLKNHLQKNPLERFKMLIPGLYPKFTEVKSLGREVRINAFIFKDRKWFLSVWALLFYGNRTMSEESPRHSEWNTSGS